MGVRRRGLRGFVGVWLLQMLAGAAGLAEPLEGRILLGELNCVGCHAASAGQGAWLTPKAAPRLDGIEGRVRAAWLQQYLAAPHQAMPGTTMPDILHGRPATEQATVAEALTHYLVAAAPGSWQRTFPDRAAIARGEVLYHRIGCVACHAPQDSRSAAAAGAPLPHLAEKWSHEGLWRFLRDPLAIRPGGRMPSMNLSEAESRDLAHYLLRETRVSAPLEVTRYRGRLWSLEDLDTAEPLQVGSATNFSLAAMLRERGYALRFSGWLRIDQAGVYTFYLQAQGACRMAVDEGWRMGQDSWQRERVDAQVKLRLDPGWHPLAVDFVQRGSREPTLRVDWEGPGVLREAIPSSRLRHSAEPVDEPVPFNWDAAKAARGRALYAELRCSACHESRGPERPLPPLPPLPPLTALTASKGCLAGQPSAAVPNYHLNAAQRSALEQALAGLKAAELAPPTPAQRLAHTLQSLRCTACHRRDGRGGVTADRDAYFTSNGEDLGDEGRIPPVLDGVGDKLRPAWLSNLLTRAVGVRPYLNTRMPVFGGNNVGHLADILVGLDRRAVPLAAVPDDPRRQREAGRRLVGTEGLSCIACHRFNRQPAHALQVTDLALTAGRLNEDWFRRFLGDPNRFNVGTRMPAFWPDGVSSMPDLLEGSTERQHAALWTYLTDGGDARFPEGLSRQNVELVVGGESVVYRGKLWEAGFRAVAVGYPGQLNAAFDAEEMRLALLWRGRFLNAGPHWGIQGMGQIRPLGTDVVVFPHGPPLAILSETSSPWPTHSSRAGGLRFRGYQLDVLQRPTLLYAFQGVEVEDLLVPLTSVGPGFHRRLTFAGAPPGGLHYRIASGVLIPRGEASWRLKNGLDGSDGLTLRLPAGTGAFVRGEGMDAELRVPIVARDGETQLEVDYVW